MSIEYAECFTQATILVLESYGGLNPQVGEPFYKADKAAEGDVTGIVGLTGESNGVFSVSFARGCALHIAKKMMSEDFKDEVHDVRDTVGEIANVVCGQARICIADKGGPKLLGALPSVVMGDHHSLAHVVKAKVVAVPITTEQGKVLLVYGIED